jgi:F-type H+-transporting ATPase subunit delta
VARPLDADQELRLLTALTRIYGRQVQLQVDVDPAVLGGIEVRVGEEVIDGTVQRNLSNVRRSLAGQ